MKKISRKKFISTTGKYIGGTICVPMMLSLISCKRITAPDSPSEYTILCNPETYYPPNESEACGHGSVFTQEGIRVSGLAQSNLDAYSAEINESEIVIDVGLSTPLILNINDHPDLIEAPGVSSTDDLLLYRKDENTIIVLSRYCPHGGCVLDPPTLT